MNTTTAAEQTALTLPQRAAVALGTAEHETQLRALVKSSADIVAVVNPAGREQAHRIGMTLKNARIAIEKVSKSAREDAVAFGKAVIAEEKRLIEIVSGEEARVFGLRDDFDAKVEAERQARIAAEVARTAAIADAIKGIRERETDAVRFCKTAAETQREIDALEVLDLKPAVYQERVADAARVKSEMLAAMRLLLDSRIAAERAAAEDEEARAVEAQRLADERAELGRLRAEADERDRLAKIEADRIAAEQAAEARRLTELAEAQKEEARRQQSEAEAELQALAARQAEQVRAEQAEVARVAVETKRQLDAMAAQIAADRQALEAERRAAEKAKQDAEDEAERIANEQRDREVQAQLEVEVQAQPIKIDPVEALIDRVNAGEISMDDVELTFDEIADMGAECGLDLMQWVERLERFIVEARESKVMA